MKVALISDLHFGVKKSDVTFQKSQLKFFENQLVEELKLRNVNTIFVLGDVFDTRQAVNVQTENVVLKLFKDTFADFDIHIIVGNHDLYYKDTTDVNSLKQFNLLSNVTVYEKPETKVFDSHTVTFLPWIVDYNNVALPTSEYCFAHLDISGFMMDKVNMCSEGISVKKLTEKFKNVYTGHFHTRSKKRIGSCKIEYIGSPYQITRIDAGQDRGCTILDLDTNTTELIVNTNSIKYLKFTYPDLPDNIEETITNNVVDIEIPYELSDESKNIFDYTQKLTACKPISINQSVGKKPELTATVAEEDLSNIDLFTLFKSYTESLKLINKDEIYLELINLYNTFKRRIKMEQKAITLKNGQVKAIVEYFNSLLVKDGKNANFSYMIYKNAEILAQQYMTIMSQIYNEAADTKFQEYVSKVRDLVTKYADRDEQGNVLAGENGIPTVTEQIAEYNTESEKLNEEYKEVLDNRNTKIQESMQILETTYEFNLYVLQLEHFPNDTQPGIVGIFGI